MKAPSVHYKGKAYELQSGESVLDALLRHGVKAAHSCKAGSCGSCLLRATEGPVPATSQSGLKDSWRARGYFLACVCRPEADLSITTVGEDARLGATITGRTRLSANVMQVHVRCDAPMDVRAGQYVTLIRECGLARSYSLASLSGECDFEIHVRRIAGGKMSSWLDEGACVGERVSVLGPSGECFYVAGKEDQPMLLVGTGTGLAPLYGILRDALRHGHRGSISLFHGAVDVSGLYLVDELLRLAGQYPQLNYTAAVLRGDESDRVAVGPVDEVVMKRFPKVSGWRAYVCGDPGLVTKLKKKLFLSGMASREIYADPFVPAAPAS